MVVHVCSRCGYITDNVTNIKAHIMRKRRCRPILVDLSVEELMDEVEECTKLEVSNKESSKIIGSQLINYKKKDTLTESRLIEILQGQLEAKDAQIDKLLEKQDAQINKLIARSRRSTNNNTLININLNAHSATDISHLTDTDYQNIMSKACGAIRELVSKVHFDPGFPENHNIYISNLRDNHVMIYDGFKWVLHDRTDAIDQLIGKSEDVLEQKLEEWVELGTRYPVIMDKFRKYLEIRDDDTVRNQVIDDIKMVLYNRRPRFIKRK
jgi:hypothetical protein